jgi:hypothetical protein
LLRQQLPLHVQKRREFSGDMHHICTTAIAKMAESREQKRRVATAKRAAKMLVDRAQTATNAQSMAATDTRDSQAGPSNKVRGKRRLDVSDNEENDPPSVKR